MGEFGCTQIRTSSSCSSRRKKDFGNQSFGYGILRSGFTVRYGNSISYPKAVFVFIQGLKYTLYELGLSIGVIFG